MGVQKCDIFYDSNSATYYPGQTINGRVEFSFDSPQKFRAIHIEFKGEANTFWNETKKRKNANGEDENYTVHYNGHEEYFNIRYNLAGEQQLPQGQHSFPFTCALPPTLPNSFEGECGYVRYFIRVVIDRPWKTDREYLFEFKVVSIVDLNTKPALRQPVVREVEESFCCCCCESGPFHMTISLPCSGYSSNQKLPIKIDCDNASNVKIEYLSIKLERLTTYYVHNPTRESKTKSVEVCGLCTDGVEEGENATFEEVLVIPENCPPSDLENCPLIDIIYSLQIKAKVGACHESPVAHIKITIGHVPIEEMITQLGGGTWEPPTINSAMLTPAPTGVIGWNADQQTNSPMNYPTSQTSYPPTSSPYPPTNQPYPPNPNQPYPPNTNQPPSQNPFYPPSDPPYPASNPAYPPLASSPYPPSNPSYPPSNPSYPPSNPSYPPSNPSYPPSNPSYPPSNSPYPPSNIPYPASTNPGYPNPPPPTHTQYPSYPPPSAAISPSAPPPQ